MFIVEIRPQGIDYFNDQKLLQYNIGTNSEKKIFFIYSYIHL